MRDFVYNNPFLFVFLGLLGLSLYYLHSPVWVFFAVLPCLSFFRPKTGLFVFLVLVFAFFILKPPGIVDIASNKKLVGVVYDVRRSNSLRLYVKTPLGRMYLFASGLYDNINPQDKILFKGKIYPVYHMKNDKFRNYLIASGIWYYGFAYRIKKLPRGGLSVLLERVREYFEREFYYFLDRDSFLFLQSSVFGDMRNRSLIYRLFVNTQTAHILSVSGLHMGFVFGVFYLLFFRLLSFVEYIYMRYNIKKLAAIIAIIPTSLYFFISGMHIPAMRSFIMVLVFIYALMGGYTRHSYNLLFFVATIVVFFEGLFAPMNPSFVLSFFMSFSAITIYSLLRGMGKMKAFFAFSVLISLFSIPITAYYFEKFSPVGVLGNIFVVPFFGFVIIPVAFVAMIASLVSWVGVKLIVFWVLSHLTHIMLGVVGILSALAKPIELHVSLTLVLCVYAVMFAAVFYFGHRITSTGSRYPAL